PSERHLVVAPLAAHHHGDLVFTGALERPIVDRGDAFDHVERIRPWVLRERNLRHAVSDESIECGLGHTPTPRAHATKHATSRTVTLLQRHYNCVTQSPRGNGLPRQRRITC